MNLQTLKLVILGIAVGLAVGIGVYTFVYAKGLLLFEQQSGDLR